MKKSQKKMGILVLFAVIMAVTFVSCFGFGEWDNFTFDVSYFEIKNMSSVDKVVQVIIGDQDDAQRVIAGFTGSFTFDVSGDFTIKHWTFGDEGNKTTIQGTVGKGQTYRKTIGLE